MKRKKILILSAVFILAAFFSARQFMAKSLTTTQPEMKPYSSLSGNSSNPLNKMAHDEKKPPAFDKTNYSDTPKSLMGTVVDGEFKVDQKGNLLATNDIRRIFDYFLSAENQESKECLIQRIRDHIEKKLKPPASGQALKLLEGYIAYLDYLEKSDQNGSNEKNSIEGIKKSLELRMEARRRYLPEEAVKAFFEEEEAEDRFNIEVLALQNRQDISSEELEKRTIELETMLPEKIRNQRIGQRLEQSAEARIKDLQSKGEENSEAIFQIRESVYGKDAAERMASRDKEKYEWKRRVEAFNQEKNRINEKTGIPKSQKTQEINMVRASMFTELEARRMEAQERLAAASRDKAETK